MPNAQTHLASVWDLLAQPPLRAAFPWLGEGAAQSAFLLGAISPDVRAISGHPREATHFFTIPPGDAPPAEAALFDAHPSLADAAALGRPHAAFVAGYITHLIMDRVWVEEVVMPGLFVDGLAWGTRHPNWRLYSLLMTHLEYRAAAQLPAEAAGLLAAAEPAGWLPFVSDRYLCEWRDHIAACITGGGARDISAMFARTNNLTPEALEAIVLDDDRMAREALDVVGRGRIAAFEAATAEQAQQAVTGYLSAGAPHGAGRNRGAS